MDRSIRDKSRRRRFLLASVTAAGAFVVVYFANAAYHELLLDKLGLSQALVDALGAAAAVLVSFLAQEALSIARYRDATGLGRKRAIQILEFFDRTGLTRRVRDTHFLRSDSAWLADLRAPR